MQGHSALNGHTAQLHQHFAHYTATETWTAEALTFLAQYRSHLRMWDAILGLAASAHIFPADVENAVDAWLAEQEQQPAPAASAHEPILMPLADVQPTDVTWLWESYIPLGKLTLLEGDPEVGKTWLSLVIAAAVTRSSLLPGIPGATAPPATPRNVVYMQAEDGFADTIRPRFDAAGGDPHRLLLLNGKRRAGDETELDITLQDLDVIETVLMAERPALLVIDPLQAYLGATIDMHRANQTRPLLSALGRLADRYQCALLCIRHLNKSGPDRAIYRGLGSIDFAAAARSVLMAGFDPADPERQRRVLVHGKSSLAPQGSSLGYTLQAGQFRWLGESAVSIDQLFSRHRDADEQSDLDEAAQFLSSLLAAGPVAAKQALKEGKKAGISAITLQRSKKQIGVKSWRAGRAGGGRGKGQWLWGLQDDQ